MKKELEGTIMTEFVALRPKSYSYLMNDGNKNEQKEQKMCNKTKT